MVEEVFGHILDLGADPNIRLTQDVLGGFAKGTSVNMACAGTQIDGEMHQKCFYDVNMDNYLKLVLKHGGDPNQANSVGETPLFFGLSCHPRLFREKVRLLLEAGADINHRDSRGETPLMKACYNGPDAMLTFLKAGADYRISDYAGWDPVFSLAFRKWGPYKPVPTRTPGPAEKEVKEIAHHGPGEEWGGKNG